MPCVYSSETVQHCMVPVKRNEPRDAIKHTHKIDERQQIFASFPLSSLCCKLKRGEEEEKEKKDFSKKKGTCFGLGGYLCPHTVGLYNKRLAEGTGSHYESRAPSNHRCVCVPLSEKVHFQRQSAAHIISPSALSNSVAVCNEHRQFFRINLLQNVNPI